MPNLNNNKNPATPGGQTQSTNGGQNNTNVVNTADQRTGNLGNQPPGGNTNAIPKPGEPTNPPAPQPQNSTQPAGTTATDGGSGTNTGLDIDKLISESTEEIKTADEAQNARVEKQKTLMTALNALNYKETIIYRNEETGEEIGTKFRYTVDPFGKTIYDYMNDEEITGHIGFVIDESDPQDGSFIEKPISIYWINPVF